MACPLPGDLVAELLSGLLAQRDAASLRIALRDHKAELKARVPEVALQLGSDDCAARVASLALWLSRHPHVARIVLSHRQGGGADVSPALAALAASACAELRLSGVRLRGACLPPMAHLRSLVLRDVSASGLSWRALAALPALDRLELHWCELGFTDGRLQLQKLTSLTRFVFMSDVLPQEAGMPGVLRLPPRVREVVLHTQGVWYTLDCRQATDLVSISNAYFSFFSGAHPVQLDPHAPYPHLASWHGCMTMALEARRQPLPALASLSLGPLSTAALPEALLLVDRVAPALAALTLSAWGSGGLALRLPPGALRSLRWLGFAGPGPVVNELDATAAPALEEIDLRQVTVTKVPTPVGGAQANAAAGTPVGGARGLEAARRAVRTAHSRVVVRLATDSAAARPAGASASNGIAARWA